MAGLHLGCAVFAPFLIRFETLQSKYGSYSLHIHMFQYIRRHHLFASFSSYSLQNIRKNSHTNIRFDAKLYMSQQIFFRANILFTYSPNGEYSLQNEFVHTREYSHTSKYSHTSEYSLANIFILAKIRLQIFA